MKREKIYNVVCAFLTAFAFCAAFHEPLQRIWYESAVDYYIANIYELLGGYDFSFVLLVGVFYLLYAKVFSVNDRKSYMGLGVFFAFCLLVGRSYHEVGTWSYCFGSAVNFMKFLGVLLGYAFFLQSIMCLLEQVLDNKETLSTKQSFWTIRPFLKSFALLMLEYGILLVISFPGNLCWDVIGQIEQVTNQIGYSAHHPLLHTLLVGGLVEMGELLFGTREAGLFLYVCLQAVLLAGALSFVMAILAKRKLHPRLLTVVFVVYMATPIYSNLVTTAVKDVPFTAFVILYFVCYALMLEKPMLLRNRKMVLAFVVLQALVILFRNNGMPLVLLSGTSAVVVLWKKSDLKERIRNVFVFVVISVLIGSMTTSLLTATLDASKGSKGEIFSLLFQQTARYLQTYPEDVPEAELYAIETVLGDVTLVAQSYDPLIADPVKALYRKDATGQELANYFVAWGRGALRHPSVYMEAFFTHVYGWFSPGIQNTIRYEAEYAEIYHGGLFRDADKVMIFLYRFMGRIDVLGILENVGMYVWVLFFFMNYQRRKRGITYMAISAPLWVCLLICMASPCFFGHPRYALPIIACVPILMGIYLSRGTVENGKEKVS